MAREQHIGNYTLKRRVLKGDVSRGLPELWTASDYGDLYYLKRWKRKGDVAGDIQALWNREVRSLMRLQGHPGAGEFFARLHDLNHDDKQYYAVLDTGPRLLLSEILAKPEQYSWARNLGEVSRRRALWEGLKRISEALSLLHSEGTLHRSLSATAIFAGPDGGGDFRLSGFEWSLRVAGTDGAAARIGQRNSIQAPELDNSEGEHSVATDWFDFGILAAQLFGIRVISRRRQLVREDVQSHSYLGSVEKETLLRFLAENPEERISSAENAALVLRDVAREINTASLGIGRPLVLAVRLGSSSTLSKAVDIASKRGAPSDEPQRQLEWIRSDLGADVRVTARRSPDTAFVVRGKQLEYRVRAFSKDGNSTWAIGFADNVEQFPRFLPDDQTFSLGKRQLEVRPLPEVHNNVATIRDRSAPWDKVFPFASAPNELDPILRDVHDFFRVTQQIDTLLAVAAIWPVRVLTVDRTDTETEIVVTPRDEPDRNDLAQNLALEIPSEQMRDWFALGAERVVVDDEEDPTHEEYGLLFERRIDKGEKGPSWRFVGAEPHPGGARYSFRSATSAPVNAGDAYLARGHAGTLAQIKRRHRAIEGLEKHADLLRFLADPLGVSRRVGDALPNSQNGDENLDQPKLDALEKIWQSRPFAAVQGPPGTGKTTLIKAFVERLLSSDPSAQVLISAHSHHTVDDVRQKLGAVLNGRKPSPIMIRLGAKASTEHDLQAVTLSLLEDIRKSDLLANLPESLVERIKRLSEDGEDDSERAVDLRTLQNLVQDSANLSFVTSNSPDLEEMIEHGRRFDWSIVEEAGKAHGFDLASALQASHRVLLIGDHFQLSPFGAQIFRRLLAEPLRVANAIRLGSQFAPTLIDRTVVSEGEGRRSLQERCDDWRRMVLFFGDLFQRASTESDLAASPVATLTHQHRMHPDIAELVGNVFYQDSDKGSVLVSPKATHERFSGSPPFKLVGGSWLPDHRIVWCDVPWVQRTEWAKGETSGLFESESEVSKVLEVLGQLRPRPGQACELQILSPYNDQLSAIRRAIRSAGARGELVDMFQYPFDLRVGTRMGATVDEFQGSEADIVIVSLVRNNAVVPWKSLGFLKEANRMNVMLSRARHKLVLVGSWDFFDSRCNDETEPDAEYSYVGRLMRELQRAKAVGKLARVKPS